MIQAFLQDVCGRALLQVSESIEILIQLRTCQPASPDQFVAIEHHYNHYGNAIFEDDLRSACLTRRKSREISISIEIAKSCFEVDCKVVSYLCRIQRDSLLLDHNGCYARVIKQPFIDS